MYTSAHLLIKAQSCTTLQNKKKPPPTCRRRFSSGRLPKSCLGCRDIQHPLSNRKCGRWVQKIDRLFPWLVGFQCQTKKKKRLKNLPFVGGDGHMYHLNPSDVANKSFPSDANLLNFAVLVVVISSTTAVIASRYSAKSCGEACGAERWGVTIRDVFSCLQLEEMC